MSAADESVLLLGGDDVDALASVELGLRAAEEAALRVSQGAVITGRVQVNGPAAWTRILAGVISPLDVLGYKQFHRAGDHVRYHVHLFRESTGEPIAVVDGRRITSLRTSSTAAVAARHRLGERPVRLGVVGSGEEAWEGLRALAGALTIASVDVFSPTEANRLRFAGRARSELGLEATAVGSSEEATRDHDAVYVATSSHHTPFLTADQVAGVGWLGLIGSTMPVHREARGEVFLAAGDVVIDTPDAAHESGDCVEAKELGWDDSAAVLLGAYLEAAPQDGGMTVFKSIGSVEQDLVLALHLVRAAREKGAGRAIPSVASLRVMR
jgi:ornithine cyclodeaminase/alanine dehydrogenase-like protein (mu-crystallin family)